MKIDQHIFQTYDIRGKFPSQFSSKDVVSLGKSFGTIFGAGKNVVIGSDVRLSSPLLVSALTTGLMEVGCHVLDIGICTTPTIYFLAAHNEEIDFGVMVTASHNPIEYNGLKVCDNNGVSYHFDNFFNKIKEITENNNFESINHFDFGQRLSFPKISTNQYWEYQKTKSNLPRELRVVVEIGNGTCFPFIPLLQAFNVVVKPLHAEPDGRFPTMIPDPAKASSLKYIQEEMKKSNYDLGIGFDTDGDRVGFVDDKGVVISSDQIIMLFGELMIKHLSNPKIMVDIKTSRATYEYLSEKGANVRYTRVGHSWIHEELIRSNSAFAGELSGHYYFGFDYYGFDDAIYSALRLLELLPTYEKSISSKISSLPFYHTSKEFRIPCNDIIKSEVVFNLTKSLKNESAELITIDGVRAEFDDGWILIRKSGTEPAISYRAEAYSERQLSYYTKFAEEMVKEEISKLLKKYKIEN